MEKGMLWDLMPTKQIERPEGGMHCVNGPALFFSNGESHHFYRTVYLRPSLFEKLQKNTITMEEWAKEQNEEVKSAILAYIEEVHGSEALYRLISSALQEVDTYVDKKDPKYLDKTTGSMNIGVYTLFKGAIDASIVEGNEKTRVILAYVRCYCPSSDRMFFLGVPPNYNNAKDAIGSRYLQPKKLIPHIKYINRQGERYATTHTEEGKRIKKTMTKEDWEDLGTISGDQYFKLLRYEY